MTPEQWNAAFPWAGDLANVCYAYRGAEVGRHIDERAAARLEALGFADRVYIYEAPRCCATDEGRAVHEAISDLWGSIM